MDDDKARKNWREYAEFEPAPADLEPRAWSVILPMLCCLWIIIIAGVWNWLT